MKRPQRQPKPLYTKSQLDHMTRDEIRARILELVRLDLEQRRRERQQQQGPGPRASDDITSFDDIKAAPSKG